MAAKGWMIVDPDGFLLPGIVGNTEQEVIVKAEGSLESASCWQDLVNLGYRTAFMREVAGTSLEAFGVSHSARKWAELLGIPHSTLRGRLRSSKSVEEAIGMTEAPKGMSFMASVAGEIDGKKYDETNSRPYSRLSDAAAVYRQAVEKVKSGKVKMTDGSIILVVGTPQSQKVIAERKFPEEDR